MSLMYASVPSKSKFSSADGTAFFLCIQIEIPITRIVKCQLLKIIFFDYRTLQDKPPDSSPAQFLFVSTSITGNYATRWIVNHDPQICFKKWTLIAVAISRWKEESWCNWNPKASTNIRDIANQNQNSRDVEFGASDSVRDVTQSPVTLG